MDTQFVRFAVSFAAAPAAVLAFVTQGRSPTLPPGAQWIDSAEGWWSREPSDANVFAELMKAFPPGQPQPAGYARIELADIPLDHREYRDAWRVTGGKIAADVEAAKAIHRDLIRASRASRFAALDGEWMKAFATGDQAKAGAIEAERQALRDAPADPAIAAAETIDALKGIWPADLPRG